MTTSTPTQARTDSTDRTPVLQARVNSAPRRKVCAARFGSAARRLLGTLMRSLASPHV